MSAGCWSPVFDMVAAAGVCLLASCGAFRCGRGEEGGAEAETRCRAVEHTDLVAR
jgi:hypothetical protein